MDRKTTARVSEAEVAEGFHYRPMSPMASLSVIAGLLALLSAALVYDLGPATFLVVSAVGLLAGFRGISSARRHDMAGRGIARAGIGLSILAIAAGFGVGLYQASTEVPEGCVPISYETLLPKLGEPVSAAAKGLDGKKVFIKGYMYPGGQTKGIRDFVLCRDNGSCCFGGQPKLDDMIEVRLKEPLTLDYHTGLRGVAGTFRVAPDTAPGGLGAILYHLEADYAR